MKYGFIKTAAASPVIKVADAEYNAQRVIECIADAKAKGVKILVFPELTLTGCSCFDLIAHRVILDGAKAALAKVIAATAGTDMLVFVGLPYAAGSRIYSCAAAICDGELLGLVPRENVDGSHFQSYDDDEALDVTVGEYDSFLSSDVLFEHASMPDLKVAVELGADMDAVTSPALRHALSGATVIAQMASFPETVTSTDEAELNLRYESKKLRCGIVMAAPGKGESTTENVYSGLCMVAENGVILASDEKENSLAVSEIDIEHMINLRRAKGGFDVCDYPHYVCPWGGELEDTALTRTYQKHPHLPEKAEDLPTYCERMLDIQVSGLVKRMEYAGLDHCVVGISGGVDSTLAVMVSAMAVKKMGLPSTNVIACTLPCFGTSSRTKSNAIVVAEQIGAEVRVIDIGKSVYQHFDDIGHAHDDYSIAFENAQARERTQVLMDIANQNGGIVVGTGDLSELALGWATYNGDHMSMYGVNASVPKTLVRYIIEYEMGRCSAGAAAVLKDILDTPISPELLPADNGSITQKTEDIVGPYELHDFFLYHMLRSGASPARIFRLACYAFDGEYDRDVILHWLRTFLRRFFAQQFKRSCLPDGPKVGTVTLSPRGDWRMPSDASARLWLEEAERLE